MSTGPHSFKKLDLQRAIKAVQQLGLTVSGIEMQKNGLPLIRVVVSGQEKSTLDRSEDSGLRSWDTAIKELQGQADVDDETAVR
jgi:hypothetical protein